jgi:hypothetical protein
MSNTATLEIPRLVPHPRETYLRQNETRIRSEAGRMAKDDPTIKRHLHGVEMAEDLYDIHDVAGAKQRQLGKEPWAVIHDRHKAAAFQLKLHHLDLLANLTL